MHWNEWSIHSFLFYPVAYNVLPILKARTWFQHKFQDLTVPDRKTSQVRPGQYLVLKKREREELTKRTECSERNKGWNWCQVGCFPLNSIRHIA